MSKLVAGNWKMFGNKDMICDIKKIDQYCNGTKCEVVICPPFPLISAAHEQTKNISMTLKKGSYVKNETVDGILYYNDVFSNGDNNK